jgi:DNA-3-methyladenine glycosylase II
MNGADVTDFATDGMAIRLPTVAPLHLEATVRVLQRRPSNPVEIWDEDRFLRGFATAEGLVVTAVENRGSVDSPDIRLTFVAGNPSAETQREIARRLRQMLALDLDPAPLAKAAERVPSLRATALALRGMRPPRFASLFETFVNVIPFQQLSLDAGIAILTRLVDRFGEHLLHGERRFAAFPSASAIAAARLPALLACGFSRGKAQALRGLAAAVDSGELDEGAIARLSTSDALTKLLELPGIGPWSAALVLLRGFGRLEVFPPGDSGATRGLNALLRLRAAGSLPRVVERFGDYRGYLYFCALGGSLLAKDLIHPAAVEVGDVHRAR